MNRFNSTIKTKFGICIDCKDGQQKPLIAGRCASYHYKLFREEERRKKAKERTHMEVVKMKDEKLEAWFKDRRKEMTGWCIVTNCGCISTKNSDKEYKRSIAHLLPKRLFKSVAAHPDNWVELCFYGKSHHTNFDASIFTWEDMKKDERLWSVIIAKFERIYPHIAPEETRHIPEILLQEL